MGQKSGPVKKPAEQGVKGVRPAPRRQFAAEEKIRIVLSGLRGEDSIAELCRREGIVQNLYYRWSKEFLEASKKRLAGDTARAATSGEVKDLRREASALKEVVADLTLENRSLKKSMSGDGVDEACDTLHPRRPRSSGWSSNRICRPNARWTSLAYPVPRFTAGMIDIATVDLRRWLITVLDRIASGISSPMRSLGSSP